MAQWQNKQQQWGAYPPTDGYQPVSAPNPGYSAPYAPPNAPPPAQQAYYGDEKDPYAGGRFRPEKKINDLFFLVFFVAQVRPVLRVRGGLDADRAVCGPVSGIRSALGLCALAVGTGWRAGRRRGQWFYRHERHPGLVRISLHFWVQMLTGDSHTVYLLLFITGAGLLLSTVYLMLVRAFTRMIMHITLVLSILLNMYAHPLPTTPQSHITRAAEYARTTG